MKWFNTKSNSRGKANVYIDGLLNTTVDTYSPTNQTTTAVFDSGELPLGQHKIKVLVTGEKSSGATDCWVECDKLEVVTSERLAIATPAPARHPLPGTVISDDNDGSVLCRQLGSPRPPFPGTAVQTV